MHDECGPAEHHEEREKHTSGGLLRGWIGEMTPEMQRRQAASVWPPSWVIATWAILLGIAALVVFAIVSVAISAR